MQILSDFVSRFGSLALSVVPWLAVGVLAAAVIQAFVPERWMARLLGGPRGLAVAIATLTTCNSVFCGVKTSHWDSRSYP